jgi:hypothetical protein
MLTAEATDFSTISTAICVMVYGASSATRIALWPDDSTAGVTSAIAPTASPPMAGRSQSGAPLRRKRSSTRVTPRMMAIPPSAHSMPSARMGT